MDLQCVLNLSDIQLVAGIAILASGFAALPCGLSVYHWKLVVYLTWLSTATHLAALTFLRGYLARNPAKRAMRLFLMAGLLVMLSAALGPTASANLGPLSDYAVCYFNDAAFRNPDPDPNPMVSIMILVFSFVVRVVKVFPLLSRDATWQLAARLMRRVRIALRHISLPLSASRRVRLAWHMVVVQPIAAACLVVLVYADFFLSMTSEVSSSLLHY